MAAPATLPCQPWTESDQLCCDDLVLTDDPCTPGDESGLAAYKWTDDELILMASNILFRKTCYMYPGECDVTLRPCHECSCPEFRCGCHYNIVPLAGRYPVLEVTEVRIDGALVPASAYRLDEYARLARIDGGVWPRHQDLSADPATDPNTFLISFKTGRPIPLELQYAAALLACELKKACIPGGGCRLPENVRTVVREGVTLEVANLSDIQAGSLQVPEIDLILQDYKCSRRPMRNRILHPMLDDNPDPGVRG